ncbi:MAG: hypothetical protein NTW52_12625 [Planctomycetota bacterium]|nr:hypothetical protein [Planctomycetota bacterium]
MRRISIKSPIVLSGLILSAAVVILTPSWKAAPPKTRLPGLDSVAAANRDFLEPTVGQPTEVVARQDTATVGLQPIGVTKKNSWNPNPSWRTDAGWPPAVRPTDLRPVTIEKIPENIAESYPLTARDKSAPPTTGDAIQKGPEFLRGSQTVPSQESASSRVIPWNSFVEESSTVIRKSLAGTDAGYSNSAIVNSTVVATPMQPQNPSATLGRTVSTGINSQTTTQSISLDQPSRVNSEASPVVPSVDPKSLSPVDAQRFIRQPKTRR